MRLVWQVEHGTAGPELHALHDAELHQPVQRPVHRALVEPPVRRPDHRQDLAGGQVVVGTVDHRLHDRPPRAVTRPPSARSRSTIHAILSGSTP